MKVARLDGRPAARTAVLPGPDTDTQRARTTETPVSVAAQRWRDPRDRVRRTDLSPVSTHTNPAPGWSAPRPRIADRHLILDRPRPAQETTAHRSTAHNHHAMVNRDALATISPHYPRGWPELEGATADDRPRCAQPSTGSGDTCANCVRFLSGRGHPTATTRWC